MSRYGEDVKAENKIFLLVREIDANPGQLSWREIKEEIRAEIDGVKRRFPDRYLNILQNQFYRLAHPVSSADGTTVPPSDLVVNVLSKILIPELFTRGELLKRDGSLDDSKITYDDFKRADPRHRGSGMTILSSIFSNQKLSENFLEFIDDKIYGWRSEEKGQNLVLSIFKNKDRAGYNPLMTSVLREVDVLRKSFDLFERYVRTEDQPREFLEILNDRSNEGLSITKISCHSHSVENIKNIFRAIDHFIGDETEKCAIIYDKMVGEGDNFLSACVNYELVEKIFSGIDRCIQTPELKNHLLKKVIDADDPTNGGVFNYCAIRCDKDSSSSFKVVLNKIKEMHPTESEVVERNKFVSDLLKKESTHQGKKYLPIQSAVNRYYKLSHREEKAKARQFVLDALDLVAEFFPRAQRNALFLHLINSPFDTQKVSKEFGLDNQLQFRMGDRLPSSYPPIVSGLGEPDPATRRRSTLERDRAVEPVVKKQRNQPDDLPVR